MQALYREVVLAGSSSQIQEQRIGLETYNPPSDRIKVSQILVLVGIINPFKTNKGRTKITRSVVILIPAFENQIADSFMHFPPGML
jgi:hypothetical protein